MIRWKCRQCGADLEAPESAQNDLIECGGCGSMIRVPGETPPTARPPRASNTGGCSVGRAGSGIPCWLKATLLLSGVGMLALFALAAIVVEWNEAAGDTVAGRVASGILSGAIVLDIAVFLVAACVRWWKCGG